uniref:C2H2-type domain-containing protein n=1 Tax=Panagrolaimus superbus TaxID=310955 RepID=A0A914Y9E7_9BILA
MGRKKRRERRDIPMFRIPPVDLTKPRVQNLDLFANFFNPPTIYGNPPISTIPFTPLLRTTPSNIRVINSNPPDLPPQKTINSVTTRDEMIKLFVLNGYSPIPVDDPPLLFNEILRSKVGLIGANQIGHVICRGQPDYETFFCCMCEHWATPSEMLSHLEDPDHQLKYVQKFFKEKYRKLIVSRSRDREALRKKLTMEISKAENDKKVVRKLNTILTVNILFKCWPSFLSHFNNLWKIEDDDVKEVKTVINLDSVPSRSSTTPAMLRRQSTTSFLSQNYDADDEEERKPNIADMNLCVYALVFIRAQAITKKGITITEIQKICQVIGVTPEMVFSDAVLEYAGQKIDSVEILVAISKYYANPLHSLSELLKKFVKTEPPLKPPKLLLELGLDNSKAAKMVRDVAMLNCIQPKNGGAVRRTYKFDEDTIYTDDFGRQQISYDGDYIEENNESIKETFHLPKRRKEE